MKIFTNGLILKKQKYKEKDRIVTVLTQSNGLIRAFVRDAENIKSPKCAGSDILCYSKLTLSEGKDAYYINDAKAIEQFPGLRFSPENVALAQYFSELLITLCPRDSSAGDFLRLILNALYLLSKNKKDPMLIKACVELKTLSLSGYMPDLIMCNECGEYESDPMTFIPHNGTIVCDKCASEFDIKGIVLPLSAVTALRHIVFSDMDKIFSFALSERSLVKLNSATESYVKTMADRNFETLNFYKMLKD